MKPALLRWARESADHTLESAAKAANVTVQELDAWEGENDKHPSIAQLRKLAAVYKRPLVVFYLPEPPRDFDALRDYRRLEQATAGRSRKLVAEARWAHEMREVALEAYNAAQIGIPKFTLSATTAESPAAVASRARKALGVTLEEQLGWGEGYDALGGWRTALEALGVLCFQITGVKVPEARGFCIHERVFPVIAVNAADAVNGRVFSLAHELAHLMLGDSATCDFHEDANPQRGVDLVEVFCNAVAGEILVPAQALAAQPEFAGASGAREWSDETVLAVARRFGVSQEVVLRRLLERGWVTRAFYRRVRDELISRRPSTERAGGDYYRNVRSKLGVPLIRGVISAYQARALTANEAAGFLRVKVTSLQRLMEQLG